ncbi:MAG: VOC family protein [Pseudomonadota bacterium]|nr:VOC family protein [Pseudomonadota bacterium]
MIDHVSLAVTDLDRATAFYAMLLAPLGQRLLVRREGNCGFGKDYPEFWLNLRADANPGDGAHVALRARDCDAVDAFHAAALAHGGACGGPPGERSVTNGKCYAAFILDPFGNRVEAVTFPRD